MDISARFRPHPLAVVALSLAGLFGAQACLGVGPGIGPIPPAAPTWHADQRLTFNPALSRTSYNFARSIATDGSGNVIVAWYDTRDGTSQVYIKRSNDGGVTWGPDTRLSQGAAGSEHPAIAMSAPHVYVAWHDFRNGKPDIYLRHSADGGTTWGAETLLTASVGDGAHPSVAASGARARVVFGSLRDGQAEVYTRGSDDYGATWSTETRVSDVPYDSWVSTVELSGANVYVGWVDYRDANEEEYMRRSTDGGATWGPVTRLTNNAADSWAPSLALSGSDVHLVWFDRRDAGVTDVDVENKLDEAMALVGLPFQPPPPRDPSVYYLPPFLDRVQQKQQAIQTAAPAWVQSGGNPATLQSLLQQFQDLFRTWNFGWEIYYKRSSDDGATWGPDTRLTFAPGLSMRPSVAVSGHDVHVVWFDGRDGSTQVYYKHSSDGGATWGPDERLTYATGNPLDDTMHPSVAVAGDSVYIAWFDQRDGNAEIYFKRKSP